MVAIHDIMPDLTGPALKMSTVVRLMESNGARMEEVLGITLLGNQNRGFCFLVFSVLVSKLLGFLVSKLQKILGFLVSKVAKAQ